MRRHTICVAARILPIPGPVYERHAKWCLDWRSHASYPIGIPNADDRKSIFWINGIAALEDKIVQRAVTEVLNAIYETDFLGFSYGFRAGRQAHVALDYLAFGIRTKKISWILDADVRSYFDRISHAWMLRFLGHRISDPRMLALIRKWLKAGVLEQGKWSAIDEGTPQGSSISPLLANVYLHYVLDLWAQQWRTRRTRGDIIIVRWADDFVVGFQYEDDAKRFHEELRDRFQRFSLELHPEKTRLLRTRCGFSPERVGLDVSVPGSHVELLTAA
jgi:group II intron reverse transcriptase/maturase